MLITNRKSHIGFRLVPKSVTSNDCERRNFAVILRYCTEFGSLIGANYIEVVEDRPIVCATKT